MKIRQDKFLLLMEEESYLQEYYMTMGSSLFHLLSNVYMEKFEQKAIDTYNHKI